MIPKIICWLFGHDVRTWREGKVEKGGGIWTTTIEKKLCMRCGASL